MGSDTPLDPEAASSHEGNGPSASVRRSSASCASLWREKTTGQGPLASEDDCLALIDELFPSHSGHVPRGRGDDCALLTNLPRSLALSTDMFWEDVHFRTSYFTPEEAGGKALAAAVSDLAASGAAPLAFSLALMLPPWLDRKCLRAVLAGMADRALEYEIFLSGGDLSRGEKLGFSVTVWGDCPSPGAPALHRGAARPGDAIFLVGEAGLAKVGLWALERWGRPALEAWPKACAAHLRPRPLLEAGKAIAGLARDRRGEAHRLSLMDLSDGLMRDLPRLLGRLGADVSFDKKIIPSEVAAAAESMNASPEDLFLLGGEDYALIGSCAGSFWPQLAEAVPEARLLGRADARPGITRHGKPLSLEGFDHFSGDDRRPASKEEAGHVGTVREHERTVSGKTFPDAMRELIAVGRDAWVAGLMAGFNGNISCRVPLGFEPLYPLCDDEETPAADNGAPWAEACLITRSGAAKGRLTEQDFSLLDPQSGKSLGGSPASTESAVHLAIYAACPQSRVVLHLHPPCLLALSLILEPEKRLALPLPEAETYRARLGYAPFQPPGSVALAEATAEAAKKYPAVWMERHGLVVHAKDAPSALSLAEELEQLAKVQLSQLAASPVFRGNSEDHL